MPDIRHEATLETEDYIRALRKIAADVDKMESQVSRDFDDIDKKGSKAFKDVGDAADKAGKRGKLSFDTLKAVVGGVAGALTGVAGAVTAAWTMANDAVAGVRVRRNFEALAAAAGTTGDAILEALTRATQGTVPEIELLTQANLAMQLGVAKTPEEFEKLARSALILGRSVGRGPVESLNDLINAAGRRSTEVLDNLGISLAAVNAKMEGFAQQEFGKTTAQLDQATRNALFMRAAIEQAAEQANVLGADIADIGSGVEAAQARVKNFQQDIGEGFLILSDRAVLAAEGTFNAWLGPDGVFAGFVDAGNAVQSIFAAIVATFFTAAGTIARQAVNLRKVLTGEMGIGEFLSPGRVVDQLAADYNTAFNKIKSDFVDIFDPAAAASGITPTILPPPEVVDEEADKLAEAVKKAQERLAEIERDGQRDRLDNALKAGRERLDAEAGFVQKRIDQARKYLQKIDDAERDLARDLDDITRDQARERIQAEREAGQRRLDNELDFQRELVRIKQRFDFELEDAARARDAVTFLRLQRDQARELDQARTNRDQQQQDNNTEASRRREELRISQGYEEEDARLSHTRKLEDLRLANQREVEELGIAEERKRAELQLANERRLADLKTSYDRKLADFKASLEAEVLALLEAEQAKTEIVRAAIAERAALDRRTQGRTDELISQGRTVLAGRAAGGPVNAGQAYLTGEKGPELFIPSQAGHIIPSHMMMGTIPSANTISNITTNNNVSLGGLLDAGSLDAILAAKVQNLLISLLGRM